MYTKNQVTFLSNKATSVFADTQAKKTTSRFLGQNSVFAPLFFGLYKPTRRLTSFFENCFLRKAQTSQKHDLKKRQVEH